MLLVDKYRPKRLAQVIGQSKAVATIRRCLRRADTGKLWIEGPSGCGKTTLAECIAWELGCRPHDVHALDGDGCTVDAVRELGDLASAYCRGFVKSPPTVVIVNEAHAMTARAVQAWLTLLERLPAGWWIVFTTTESRADLFGDFSGPFASRCTCIRLTSQGLCDAFARLAQRIATREHVNGRPLGWYQNLVKRSRNNLRAVLQAVDDGAAMEADS